MSDRVDESDNPTTTAENNNQDGPRASKPVSESEPEPVTHEPVEDGDMAAAATATASTAGPEQAGDIVPDDPRYDGTVASSQQRLEEIYGKNGEGIEAGGNSQDIEALMESIRQAGLAGQKPAGPESTYPPNVELQIRQLYSLRGAWQGKLLELEIPSPMDRWATDKYHAKKKEFEAQADRHARHIIAVAKEHNPALLVGQDEDLEVVVSRILADVRPPNRIITRTVLSPRGNVMT